MDNRPKRVSNTPGWMNEYVAQYETSSSEGVASMPKPQSSRTMAESLSTLRSALNTLSNNSEQVQDSYESYPPALTEQIQHSGVVPPVTELQIVPRVSSDQAEIDQLLAANIQQANFVQLEGKRTRETEVDVQESEDRERTELKMQIAEERRRAVLEIQEAEERRRAELAMKEADERRQAELAIQASERRKVAELERRHQERRDRENAALDEAKKRQRADVALQEAEGRQRTELALQGDERCQIAELERQQQKRRDQENVARLEAERRDDDVWQLRADLEGLHGEEQRQGRGLQQQDDFRPHENEFLNVRRAESAPNIDAPADNFELLQILQNIADDQRNHHQFYANQFRHINHRIERLTGLIERAPAFPTRPPLLPMRTRQNVEDFQTTSDEEFQGVVSYLAALGGFSLHEAANFIVKHAIEDSLSPSLTWQGREPGTMKMQDTRLANAFHAATAKNTAFPKPTVKEFIEAMTSALKASKQRYRNRQKLQGIQRPRENDPAEGENNFPGGRRRRLQDPDEPAG